MFPIGEDFNVGIDPLTPVTDEYSKFDNALNGEIAWVRIDLGDRVEITPAREVEMEVATQ
jgi:hypothetical protein